MHFFLASPGSRSTGSLCSISLPLGDHGAGEQEGAVTQAAPVEISPDWGKVTRGENLGVVVVKGRHVNGGDESAFATS